MFGMNVFTSLLSLILVSSKGKRGSFAGVLTQTIVRVHPKQWKLYLFHFLWILEHKSSSLSVAHPSLDCLEKQDGTTRWQDATELELSQIQYYKTFKDHGKAIFINSKVLSNAPRDIKRLKYILSLMVDTRHDLLPIDV